MPSLNLNLSDIVNLKLNELVVALKIEDPLRGSNRSHAARLAIVTLYGMMCHGERYVSTEIVEATLRRFIESIAQAGCDIFDVDSEVSQFMDDCCRVEATTKPSSSHRGVTTTRRQVDDTVWSD